MSIRRQLSLLWTALVLTLFTCNVESAHYGRVKGESLRREQGLKLNSLKRRKLHQEKASSSVDTSAVANGRQLNAGDFSKSRIGAFGDEENVLIGPYETETDASESGGSATTHNRRANTSPPDLDDLADEALRFSNSSSVDGTLVVIGGHTELISLAPTEGPTTVSPTKAPITSTPTKRPTTSTPTKRPTTLTPTKRPTTLTPTKRPTTLTPTKRPITLTPTKGPTFTPTKALTDVPLPVSTPSTPGPTNPPITNAPITNAPITNPPITHPPITNPPATAEPIVVVIKMTNPPSTMPPTEPAVISKAQEAGETIVAGVTQNLAQGKGPKGGRSSKASQMGAASGDVLGAKEEAAKAAKAKGKKSKYGASGVSSSFDGAYGVSGKGGKKAKYAGTGVSSSFDAAYGASGKGGKGSKYAATGVSSSIDAALATPEPVVVVVVSPGVGAPQPTTIPPTTTPPMTTTPAPITPTQTSPSPTQSPVVVAGAVDSPAPTNADRGVPEGVQVDCEAIGNGTASTEGSNLQSFQAKADWVLAEDADFDKVAAEVQQYLQSEVAPAIAGCGNNRQRRQRGRGQRRRKLQFMTASALITNVVFDTPTSPGEGSCVIDQVDRCFATEEDIDMYYYGAGTNLGQRLLTSLQAATYDVDGLLGVVNLKVFDSDGDEVGVDSTAGTGSSGTGSSGTGSSGTESSGTGSSETGSSGSGVGNQGGSGADGDNLYSTDNGQMNVARAEDDSNGDGGDEGLSSWSQALIIVASGTAFLGLMACCVAYRRHQAIRDHSQGEGKIDFDSLPPEIDDGGLPTNGDIDQQFSRTRTWPEHEDQSVASEEEVTDIQVSATGQTHQCGSGYCEVCAGNQPRIQFISSNYEPEQEQLPEDATRNYIVSDTVAL